MKKTSAHLHVHRALHCLVLSAGHGNKFRDFRKFFRSSHLFLYKKNQQKQNIFNNFCTHHFVCDFMDVLCRFSIVFVTDHFNTHLNIEI